MTKSLVWIIVDCGADITIPFFYVLRPANRPIFRIVFHIVTVDALVTLAKILIIITEGVSVDVVDDFELRVIIRYEYHRYEAVN